MTYGGSLGFINIYFIVLMCMGKISFVLNCNLQENGCLKWTVTLNFQLYSLKI